MAGPLGNTPDGQSLFYAFACHVQDEIGFSFVILIALGSNLSSQAGDSTATLKAALANLADNGVAPVAVSRMFRTPAWPDPRDPQFVNAVAHVVTELSPSGLMEQLHKTEIAFGRVRGERNAPRSLDLDILDYDGRIDGGPPVLPHPRICDRAFVLVPLKDVAPGWRHPVSGRSVDALVTALPAGDVAAVTPV
jgi:2-amino-4-hydroxy-6-hydroxymethyldihydropteridine diphosphokinase